MEDVQLPAVQVSEYEYESTGDHASGRLDGLQHAAEREVRRPTKLDLELEIAELTRGARVAEYRDPTTGQTKRTQLGIDLPRNRWGQCSYRWDELLQIRDWLRMNLKEARS